MSGSCVCVGGGAVGGVVGVEANPGGGRWVNPGGGPSVGYSGGGWGCGGSLGGGYRAGGGGVGVGVQMGDRLGKECQLVRGGGGVDGDAVKGWGVVVGCEGGC